MGKPGNKIKNEDAAVSVRNAADTDYVNFIAKNATFKGDLIVEGQSFVTEAETVEIKDNILLLNKGEAGSGVTKGMAGLQIDRGTEPDFQILFVESDRRFKAGEEGNLQCLALRDDDGNMLDGMFTTWDSATHRLKTTNIIPSTRKLFFNTNANSLGFASHTYDSSYSADSFVFTKEAGSLFFSAGTTNLNLDTDKTYFRFYKNLFIPSSIVSSGTRISLLNNSGATIATFGSPSTINSSLNVANQVIIKGGANTKFIMQSSDADNFNLIQSLNSSGTVLSTLGYYGSFWGIDNKKIATEEFANNKFLPLAGGTMTGNIMLPDAGSGLNNGHIGTTSGESLVSWNGNNVYISTNSHSTYIRSGAANLMHVRNGISYTIYDSYNFNPGNYLPLTGGNLSGNLYMNNALVATQSWVNSQGFLKSVSGYLPLSGGTMTGSISFNGDTGHIVVGARETSNFVSAVSFNKGSATNSAYIGYHSTGGSDSSGALILVPYSTSANPWAKTVGLYIAKNELLLDGKAIATTDQIPSIPSISISNSGSGNAVTAISASGHTLTVTKGATYLTSSSLSGYATQSWVTSQGYLTSSSLSDYATQTWVNNKNYAVRESDNVLISHSNEFNFTASSNTSISINYRGGSGSNTSAAITEYRFYNGQGSYSNVNLVANSFTGSLKGNATTATTATKLGSSTIGGTAKPIYLSSGTATACSATVGSSTVPVYMSSGTITQCSTTLGVSITGNAATATTASNSNNLGGYAAATYVKSTSTTKVSDIQVVTTAGSTTGVLYVVLES